MTKHDAARKQKIIDYIAATVRERGYPPSVREIAAAVDLASTSAVHHHLQALEREGYLERGASHSRALRLTPTAALRAGLGRRARAANVMPFEGRTAAGRSARSPPAVRSRPTRTPARRWPCRMLVAAGGDAYVLRVRGDSMIDAHITDGDYVVIRPQQTARDGDIVVAQVEENAVTLKRFFKEKGRVRLQPANEQYPPQFYDDVRIQGKLIGVIRRVD